MTPIAQIMEERLAEFERARLAAGHGSSVDTACAVDWSAYLAGADFSDDGKAANMSPAIRDMLVRLNDRLDDERRQLLKPYIPRAINTNDGRDKERRQLAVVWAVKTALPQWLELAGMTDRAIELRNLDVADWTPELRDLLRKVSDECYETRAAARDRLRDKILAELKKRPAAVAAADAVADADAAAAADADAAAVADAVADAVAAAAADAAAAAAAVADAVADAVAAAAAAADADAAAAAVAAAAADADAAADARGDRWATYDAVYKAVKDKVKPIVQQRVGPLEQMLPEALELLDRMINLDPKAVAA